MSSRQLDAIYEESANKELAEILGITHDDLRELIWDVDTNESNDGLAYETILTFSEDSPREILDKIDGMDDDYTFRYIGDP